MSVDVFTKWWLYNWGGLIKPRHLNSKLNYTVHSQVTANATIFCWGVKRFWRVRLCVINQPQECFPASHLGLYEILSDTRRNYASHNNIHLLHSCFLSSSWIKNPTFLNNLSNPGKRVSNLTIELFHTEKEMVNDRLLSFLSASVQTF